jgi:hypothetical protein
MKPPTNSANHGATLAEASKHLALREPFHTGTLSASWKYEQLQQQSIYRVRSYGVVIAEYPESWGTGGWVFEDAYNYSTTTSKHANIVKKAWGI